MAGRLIWLQWLGASKYRQMGSRQFLTKVELPGQRGLIYDRNGALLAGNVPGLTVYQCEQSVSDPTGVLRDAGIVPKSLGNRKALLLARNVNPQLEPRLKQVKGVFTRPGLSRFYPLKDAAGPLLGKVGYDGVGLGGVELVLDDFLRGEPGYEVMMRTADGVRIAVPGTKRLDPVPGWDIYLTIDADLQDFCYQVIKQTVETTQADKGFVVVMNPNTGEILALTQFPAGHRIYALTDPYEPGSTFKPFIMARALEMHAIDLDDSVPIGSGKLRVGKHLIGDVESFSSGLTWRDAIIHSSNRSLALLALKIGPENVYEIIRRFGFFTRTDVGLPGEWARKLPRPSRWRRIRTANAGMGQGVMVTGIQMAAAYCAVANRGQLLAPRIISRMTGRSGNIVFQEKRPVRRVLSPDIADSLIQLMIQVVDSGTGRNARIPGVRIAGKTGTAQKVDPERGGYSKTKVIASFVGLFPALSPEYVVYVVVDEPKTAHYGGQVAAPAFRRIALFLLNRQSGLLAMGGSS